MAATHAATPLPPPKKSHTLRNVLLIILALFILFVGGCLAIVGMAANSVDKSIKKSENESGGTNNPITIVQGKAFNVRGFNYKAGWRVVGDGAGGVTVKHLRVTNHRSKKDSALVEIKFMKGSEVLGLSDCTTDPIMPGQTVLVSCIGTDGPVKGYKRITINDTF